METKMNNQEAIKLLINQKRECESVLRMILDDITKNIYTKQLEMCNVAIEALEKQIPKKVGETVGDYENSYYCDRCGQNLRYEHQKYCEDCGGKQRW